MRWEKKLTEEQSERIQELTDELVGEIEKATGPDENIFGNVEVDAGWNAIEEGADGNLDLRFRVSFRGLTEHDVRSLINAASLTIGMSDLERRAKQEKAAKAGR